MDDDEGGKTRRKESRGNTFTFTANSPLLVPPAPGTGDDTTALYVGGGGVLRLLCFELGEVTFSAPSSLGWLGSVILDCPS